MSTVLTPWTSLLANVGVLLFGSLAAVVLLVCVLYVHDRLRQRRIERGIREMRGEAGPGSFGVKGRAEPLDPHPRPYRVAASRKEDE